MRKIPRLYETEPTPVDEKIIYEKYYLPTRQGFFWLLAEYDPNENLAFGYACLNDTEMAEWGYFDLRELEDVGVELDRLWEPCTFKEAIKRLWPGD